VTGTGVNVANSASVWGQSVHIEGIASSYDASLLGLTLGNTATSLGDVGSGVTVTGTAGSDVIYDASATGAETLVGGSGNDYLIGGAGNNLLQGGDGADTAVIYSTPTFSHASDGSLLVTSASGGVDKLQGVEYLRQVNSSNQTVHRYVLIDGHTAASGSTQLDTAIANSTTDDILVAGGSLSVTLAQAQALNAKGATFLGADVVQVVGATAAALTDPQLKTLHNIGVDSVTVVDTPTNAHALAVLVNAAAPNSYPAIAQIDFASNATVSAADGADLLLAAQSLGSHININPVANADTATAQEAGINVASDTGSALATGNVIVNSDTDAKGGSLSVASATHGTTTATLGAGTTVTTVAGDYGTLTINQDGSYSYAVADSNTAVNALAVSASLTDTFTYSVADGLGGTASSTLTITVQGTNDAPVISAISKPALVGGATFDVVDTANHDAFGVLTGAITATDAETATSSLVYKIVDPSNNNALVTTVVGTYGTLTLAGNTYNFTPDETAINKLSANATQTFTLNVDDTQGGSAQQQLSFSIQGVNDTPVITAISKPIAQTIGGNPYDIVDTAAADTFSAVTGSITASDAETATNALTYKIVGANNAEVTTFTSALGTLTLTGGSSYSFAPNATAINALSADATQTFTLKVLDGSGASSTENLVFNIHGVNDTPVISAISKPVGQTIGSTSYDIVDTTSSDTFSALTGSVTASDAETATGSLIYKIVGANNAEVTSLTTPLGTLTLTGSSYSFTPTASAINALSADTTQTFTLKVLDAVSGASSTQNLVFNIHGVNDTPVVTAAPATNVLNEAGG
jgi:VCBS repeat-containing protein